MGMPLWWLLMIWKFGARGVIPYQSSFSLEQRYEDDTVVRLSCLYSGNFFTVNTAFLGQICLQLSFYVGFRVVHIREAFVFYFSTYVQIVYCTLSGDFLRLQAYVTWYSLCQPKPLLTTNQPNRWCLLPRIKPWRNYLKINKKSKRKNQIKEWINENEYTALILKDSKQTLSQDFHHLLFSIGVLSLDALYWENSNHYNIFQYPIDKCRRLKTDEYTKQNRCRQQWHITNCYWKSSLT